MNNLNSELHNNRLLYRELFAKANEGLLSQINKLKMPVFCKKCRSCCNLRYTDLSPSEIYDLSLSGDNISADYINLFVPYGADENFSYEVKNSIAIEENNNKALAENNEYVKLLLSKSEKPLYFYHCKHSDKPNNSCLLHKNKNFLCTNFPNSVSTILPNNCGYREWQKLSVEKINNDIAKDILIKLKEIDEYRKTFSCSMCGTCCRLASSEFSYEELKQKAQNGDNFASQFTSVFIPYNDIEDAKKIFPEFVETVIDKLGHDEKVHFYHCPHVTEDNLCSRYEDRPPVCRDFPNNPLSVLPTTCKFDQWKDEVQVAAMLLHALIEISGFYTGKIKNALD